MDEALGIAYLRAQGECILISWHGLQPNLIGRRRADLLASQYLQRICSLRREGTTCDTREMRCSKGVQTLLDLWSAPPLREASQVGLTPQVYLDWK